MKLSDAAGLIATSGRTLPRFRLVRATDIAGALGAVKPDQATAFLAGGTDLPARFNEGFAPAVVVDISRIEQLQQIGIHEDSLVIGAGVTHAAGATHPLIVEHLPSFGQAWSRIANVRIRLSATIGGNLMARRTRYEAAILLSALDAKIRFATPGRAFDVPVETAFDPPSGALLTAIVIPLRKGLRLDYERSMRPIMTQAVALDAAGIGRLVTATEFVRPRIQAIVGGARLADAAPAAFGDPVTSDSYLQRMQGIFWTRQLQRLRAV